jgi:hypothetical protein
VQVIEGKAKLFDAFDVGGLSDEEATSLDALGAGAAGSRPLDLLERAAPDVAPFAEALMPLAGAERRVVALPFVMLVR